MSLILTRKKGEQILINNGQIKIKVLYIKKNVVALGINAPFTIPVDREEIFLRKQNENNDAVHQLK